MTIAVALGCVRQEDPPALDLDMKMPSLLEEMGHKVYTNLQRVTTNAISIRLWTQDADDGQAAAEIHLG